jgi:hypothetical protein
MPRSTSGAAKRSSHWCGQRPIPVRKGSYVSYRFDASPHRVFLRRPDNSREVTFMIGESVLSNTITQEVTQPLTAMMAHAAAGLRWLDRASPDLDEAKTAFRQIASEGKRVASVIERVQTILRTGGLDASAFDTHELVRETIKLLEDSLHRANEQ